jgi:PKD repeat protein
MKRWIAGFLFLLKTTVSVSQIVQANFSVPAQACINQNIEPVNLSTNATRYEWDFCQGDLALAPSASLAVTLGGSVTTGVDVVFDGVGWYGFIANQNNNSILKLSFGADINSTPTITDLGNISGAINSPTDIKVVVDNGNWYGFVYGLNSPMISRIDFGSSLNNPAPSAGTVISGSGSTNSGFDMIREGAGWMMVLSYFNSAKIVRLTSVTAIPTVSDILETTPFGSSLGDVAIVKSNASYFAYAVDFGNRNLYRMAFGSSVFTTPVVTNLTVSVLSGVTPFGIDVGQDNLNYYALISTIEGSLVRINLGQNLFADSPTGVSLGNSGVLENTLKIKLLKHQSRWFAFTPSWSSTRLYRVNFGQPACEISPAISTLPQPLVNYSSSGNKALTLRAFAASGEYAEMTQPVLITTFQAPDLTINFSNYCIASPTDFTVSSSLPLTAYTWDFGDAGTATTASPSHQYAFVGAYDVKLIATATNGCQNSAKTALEIFNIPVANFSLPVPAVTCTYHEYLFNNTSMADAEANVTWQWQVDNVNQSVAEDALLSFSSVDSHEVKLIASIPGCSSEISKNFTVSESGPNVDFSSLGFCQSSSIVFTNTTSGPVNNFSWDFGDGQTSADNNPSNVYSSPGNFTVTLTASNSAGCSNIRPRPLTIFSKPQVNFTALAPPFSCTGTPTRFSDLTPPPGDSNLNSWSWNFGDTGSSSNTSTQRNPQHTYATAADYTVSLTVTTNFSCSETLQKAVTIHQTPVATFTHSALCEDAEVTFSDAASTNQAWNWQVGSSVYFTEDIDHIFNTPGNYDVTLSVTGINNCIGSITETLVIPNKLNVNFSALKTCVNQEAEFTDLTNDSSDPITNVNWDFDDQGTAAITPATFIFSETGTVDVTLTVTTQSGCAYPLTKPISIEQGPLAAFTATPNSGEGPLTVQFANTSLNANAFKWKFNSTGSASTLPSPSFIYFDEGTYTVELVATDLNSCSDTTRQLIEVLTASEVNPPAPNPGPGKFTIEWRPNQETETAIVLVDAVGREMRNFKVMANAGINRYILDIKGEKSGLYILKIRYLNTIKTYRLMVFE